MRITLYGFFIFLSFLTIEGSTLDIVYSALSRHQGIIVDNNNLLSIVSTINTDDIPSQEIYWKVIIQKRRNNQTWKTIFQNTGTGTSMNATWNGISSKGKLLQNKKCRLLLKAKWSNNPLIKDVIEIPFLINPLEDNLPSGSNAPFIPEAPAGTATHWVSPLGNNNNPGTQALPWRQISYAAQAAQAGYIIEILDGTYNSPIIIGEKNGTEQNPIIFRAADGNVQVDGSGTSNSGWDQRDAIYIYDSSYIVIHGLKVYDAYRSGSRVSSSTHITIQGCVFGNNGTWGIFTDFSHDLKFLGNECFGSKNEHGIYHSNSGDRTIISGNYCHDNRDSGIQINADPSQGDDGISSECVIERNLIIRNGIGGGSAINLASVRNSTIRNNLLYGNRASGIAMWDDGQGIQWGCKNNLIEHNTIVHFSGQGRFALLFWNGSTGNTIRNNILIGGQRGAITFTADSLNGIHSNNNLMYIQDGGTLIEEENSGDSFSLSSWQALTQNDNQSINLLPTFINAAQGDYALALQSPGLDQGLNSGLANTYTGSSRPQGNGYDIGAMDN